MRVLRASAVVLTIVLATFPAAGPSLPAVAGPTDPEPVSLVTLSVPDQAAMERLVATGADLTERVRPQADGSVQVDAVVTDSQLAAYRPLGATLAPKAAPQAKRAPTAGAAQDQIVIERAVWFKSRAGYFLSVEASSSAGGEAALSVSWKGKRGTSGQAPLVPYVDVGSYLGHQFSTPVPATEQPQWVTVTSATGGKADAKVSEWPDGERPDRNRPGYQKDFITQYMPPAQLNQRVKDLHKRYPKLTDIITLPNRTNGYRRHAQAVIGTPPGAAIVATSNAYGSEGGNDLGVELVDPGAADRPLRVTVNGKQVSVSLATDASGKPVSTAAQAAAAINATAGSPVRASVYQNDPGQGVLAPVPLTQLTDSLKAPADVSRAPARVLALRVGVHRDGSRPGVLAYAQEHAREWVTPLVTIETAERLLRNYDRDPATRKLLRRTDIFIVPTVNPDGANYSFYDFNFQRKNMTNHCPAAQADPARRDSWGVDINRNYAVGSLFDGYFGASTNCLSGTFAGPAEHSEPESRNVIWLAKTYRNIKFAMNVHSYGGYFMWPPGAYKLEGRVPLPRPSKEQEAYFLRSARTIEQAIAAERGTVTWPQQTGPVTDVLYSAAGNSADELWYDYGIFGWDFEVGNDIWNPETKQWEGVGFQPPFEEGHQEALEFASGLISLIGVAADYREP
ncbi:M14 family zinc carboxypeptidase [Spongiactinospora sp. TRM90649]|uniref:M14 family zinc carboxypeptidase n=1 Tax=Spongiactinospora sp. TRM90649 TaxID=3031114 RepID=UPI0023F9A2B1|nr:M14 family zinc carboxypeptidase [Spongiactinospora sp. TRM90649]MDF5751544.1 M14 family zinc carboxypeptidase [Spongiactinospora sp. TRM90649]